MNESRTRTGWIFDQLAAIWQDTSYASQRLTAINRPGSHSGRAVAGS